MHSDGTTLYATHASRLALSVVLATSAALSGCDGSTSALGVRQIVKPAAEQAAADEAAAAAAVELPRGPIDGARLAQQNGCLRCHAWDGVELLDEGLALDWAGDKLRPDWIDAFLRDPSASRMPVIPDLDDATRSQLVAFLVGMRREPGFAPATEGDARRGAELYRKLDCAKCHSPGRPEPDLTNASSKLRRDWLVAYLENPLDAQHGARMPSFALSRQDAGDLAQYLLEGSTPFSEVPPSSGGLDTYVRLGCITCHSLQRFQGTEMRELLVGQRTFDLHARGGPSVPRIPMQKSQLGPLRAALREWIEPRAAGAEALAETGFEGYWRFPFPAQGPAPREWSGLESSLHPAACGTCHPRQYYDWKDSLHARAYSFGFEGDMLFMNDGRCLNCHAPLAEQREQPVLRVTSINCTSCHVRLNARHGPPLVTPDVLEANRRGTHGGARRDPYFEASEFCAPCHQSRGVASVEMEGGHLMNTHEEWKASPAARAGQTCQSCHMPGRRHLWRGIHDPAIVRQYLKVAVEGRRILVTNEAGHHTPTYTVPLIRVSAWLEDRAGGEVQASRRTWSIRREVVLTGGAGDHDVADTRLAAGETRAYDYDVEADAAAQLVVSVDVEPDFVYQELYRSRLELPSLTEEMRYLFQQARDQPLAEPYNVTVQRVPLAAN